ncbi:hypothetical protein OG389_28940 [Streptomyces sp. NBC_00435]
MEEQALGASQLANRKSQIDVAHDHPALGADARHAIDWDRVRATVHC